METSDTASPQHDHGEQAPSIKFTPGPWLVRNFISGMCSQADVLTTSGAGVAIICGGNWGAEIEDAEVAANAKLIAATPELLLALQDVREILTDADVTDLIARIESAFITIDTAIAKATGAA